MRTDDRPLQARWLAIVLVGAWLLSPALTPAHVEGFSASIVSLALHLNEGRLADYDRLHPANLEYFTLSRLGSVSFVSILTGPVGLSADWAMRMTTWLGLVTLATSSFVLVRRWTNASRITVALALLLIPGVAESAFFYNDTIFAAALGATALAIVSSSSNLWIVALSGALFGAAIVARSDAVLLAPAVALIGYERYGIGRAFWARASVFTVGALVPAISVPAAFDATLFDVVAITRYAIVLWGNHFSLPQHARELSLFLGIPAAILAAMGCLRLARVRDPWRLALLVGVPVLFNLVALGKIWQARQLLPLTPFFAALLILGWQHLSSLAPTRDARLLRTFVLAVCGVALVAPMVVVRDSDGPRVPYGRLWSPVLWRHWQQAGNANQAEIRSLVAEARVDTTAIITDTWDGDRYLHLALQEEGYRSVQGEGATDSCAKLTETFTNGRHQVLHVRLHQPFLRDWKPLAASRLQAWQTSCAAAQRPGRIVRLSRLEQLWWTMTDSASQNLVAARDRALHQIAEARFNPQLAVEIRDADLASLHDAYVRQAQEEDSMARTSQRPAMSLHEVERLMAARVWRSAADSP